MEIVKPQIMEPEVQIELGGKIRIMRVDFGALSLIEERTGRTLAQMSDFKAMRTKEIISLVWAVLVHEDPNLTEKMVGTFLTLHVMPSVLKAFSTALYVSVHGVLPDAEVPEVASVEADPLPFRPLPPFAA